MTKSKPEILTVIVTNRLVCPEPLPLRLRKIARSRPDFAVLREPDLDDARYAALARECADALGDVPLIFHSHPRAAAELGAEFAWLPFPERGRVLPRGVKKIISVHNAEEAKIADDSGAAQIVAGNIFETPCKPGAPARGLDFLREIAEAVSRPVWAIGGITPDNARKCAAAGAAGVCVMTSAMTSRDPENLVAELKAKLKGWR